jgi:hypothetical protein
MNWDYDKTIGDVNVAAHTGLLLAEDAAIKEYLLGLTVPDREKMTDVDVWFRYPEGERRIKYPFITIDFLALNPSTDRWLSYHRVTDDAADFQDLETGEITKGMYIPSTSSSIPEPSSEDVGHHIDPYLMYTIIYQVAVHTRSALHDRYLLSRFMTDVFPPRPFWIRVDADSTWRRCELMQMQPADTLETNESGSKRIFRKIYTISMDVEIPQSKITEVTLAKKVHTDFYVEAIEPEPVTHLYTDVHEQAEPINVVPPSGT